MHSRCFRQPKNNFNEIDISQGLDWEPPALSLHFLLAINDHRSLKGAVLAAENNFLEHNGVSHSKLDCSLLMELVMFGKRVKTFFGYSSRFGKRHKSFLGLILRFTFTNL